MMKDSKVRYFTFFMWYFFPQACDCDLGRHEVCLEHLLQTKANIGRYVVFNVARLHDCFDFISLVQLQSTSLFWCSSRSFFNSCESLGWILAWQNIEGKSGYCPYYMYKVAHQNNDMAYNQEVSMWNIMPLALISWSKPNDTLCC